MYDALHKLLTVTKFSEAHANKHHRHTTTDITRFAETPWGTDTLFMCYDSYTSHSISEGSWCYQHQGGFEIRLHWRLWWEELTSHYCEECAAFSRSMFKHASRCACALPLTASIRYATLNSFGLCIHLACALLPVRVAPPSCGAPTVVPPWWAWTISIPRCTCLTSWHKH